jgi:hypothetical protein
MKITDIISLKVTLVKIKKISRSYTKCPKIKKKELENYSAKNQFITKGEKPIP